jgi:hypothetical protein
VKRRWWYVGGALAVLVLLVTYVVLPKGEVTVSDAEVARISSIDILVDHNRKGEVVHVRSEDFRAALLSLRMGYRQVEDRQSWFYASGLAPAGQMRIDGRICDWFPVHKDPLWAAYVSLDNIR